MNDFRPEAQARAAGVISLLLAVVQGTPSLEPGNHITEVQGVQVCYISISVS